MGGKRWELSEAGAHFWTTRRAAKVPPTAKRHTHTPRIAMIAKEAQENASLAQHHKEYTGAIPPLATVLLFRRKESVHRAGTYLHYYRFRRCINIGSCTREIMFELTVAHVTDSSKAEFFFIPMHITLPGPIGQSELSIGLN